MPMNIQEAYRTQNSKYTGQEKKFLPSHNNQNTKGTTQRKNIKNSKRKTSRNI
jgi:hypothetical protein